MKQKDIELANKVCEEVEVMMSKKFMEILHDHGSDVLFNVLFNITTNSMSKTLLMLDEEGRQSILGTILEITDNQVKESEATIRKAILTIDAQPMNSTCQPFKH